MIGRAYITMSGITEMDLVQQQDGHVIDAT